MSGTIISGSGGAKDYLAVSDDEIEEDEADSGEGVGAGSVVAGSVAAGADSGSDSALEDAARAESAALLAARPGVRFSELKAALRASRGGRSLLRSEMTAMTAALVSRGVEEAAAARAPRLLADAALRPESVLVFTAYSDDYSLGAMCEAVNRRYAAAHGYRFESVVLPLAAMLAAIAPRAHATWYKVLLMRQLLATAEARGIAWLLWIDADAAVINPAVRLLEDVVAAASGRELIVGEDVHPTSDRLNAGVLLVRAGAWARALWDEVYDCSRFFAVPTFDQAALLWVLRVRRESLWAIDRREYFSYLPGGRRGSKLFAHVCVLPAADLNSNRILGDDAAAAAGADGRACQFIFHPAGGKRHKRDALLAAFASRGVAVPPHLVPERFCLRNRDWHGRPRPEDPARDAEIAAARAEGLHTAAARRKAQAEAEAADVRIADAFADAEAP